MTSTVGTAHARWTRLEPHEETAATMTNVPRSTPVRTNIAPWLSVNDGDRAVDFYKAAFGAVEQYRLQDDAGKVMVAQLAVDEADFWVQGDPDASPGGGDGSIRMILTVEEPEAVFRQALAAGATEIAPVSEGHGWRIGRLADPFGHQWEVGKPLT
jgi:PhnB protein